MNTFSFVYVIGYLTGTSYLIVIRSLDLHHKTVKAAAETPATLGAPIHTGAIRQECIDSK